MSPTSTDPIILLPPEEASSGGPAEAMPSPAGEAVKLTCDQWAARKGYVSKRDPGLGITTTHVGVHFVAGAKAANGWDEHFVVTEAEFDAAVDQAANFKIG